MRPTELKCGTAYRGERSVKHGRFRVRRLVEIKWIAGYAPDAVFIEESEPFSAAGGDKGAERRMTLRSFARWAVEEAK